MAWKVKFFQLSSGKIPVKEFLESRDIKTQARIWQHIRLLIEFGPFLKPPYIKKLKGRLYELRVSGSVAVRIFYLIHENQYYLLHAFIKKSQKTPSKEIKTAIDRSKNFI